MKNTITRAIAVCMAASILAIVSGSPSFAASGARTISVKSPDGQTEVVVTVAGDIRYDVISRGETLMAGNRVALCLDGRTLGESSSIKSSRITAVRETVRPDFRLKFSEVENNYNLLTLAMKDGYRILWRVYDDGVAYRFETSLPGEIEVLNEVAEFNMAGSETITGQIADEIETACEELYTVSNTSNLDSDRIWEIPFVATYPHHKVLVSEFDLEDYPALFVKPCGEKSVAAFHPLNPVGFAPDDDRNKEGPSPLFLNRTDLIVFFDRYKKHQYGAVLSRDHGDTWEDVSSRIEMPEGMSHGTAIRVDRKVVERLIKVYQ